MNKKLREFAGYGSIDGAKRLPEELNLPFIGNNGRNDLP